MKNYDYKDVLNSTLEYFNNDTIAAEVWIKKYALKDENGNICELNPDDMHKRLAKEFARIEEKKYKSTSIKPLTYDEIYNYFKNFKYIIPQGSPMFGIGNNFQYVSLSNCFVVETPYDSYGSIIRSDEQLVQISKRRGGVGIDLSNIRPKGMKVNNSSRVATGVTLFMERYSNSIKEVGQEGRRGALMITLSVHHPDIEDFITIKRDLTKVTGANVSVKITNEFLNALENNTDYELRYPVDSNNPIIRKRISAKYIWDKIIESNWLSAEPGILLWDNIINESIPDCYTTYGFGTVSTNPCITLDTLIATEAGDVPLKELLILYENGYKLPKIYAYDPIKQKLVKDEILKIFKTKEKTLVYKLYFSNRKSIKVTPEHLIYTVNKQWAPAGSITKSDIVAYLSFDKFSKNRTIDGTTMTKRIKSLYEDVYDITTKEYHCFFGNSILLHNCSEIPLCELDSCRLMAINMFSFVENPFQKNAYFNFDKFKKCIYDAQRLMDDLVDLEIEKIEKIIEKIKNDPEPDHIKRNEMELWENIKTKAVLGRRTGLSSTGWADMLAALNIKYDSEEAIKFIDEVMKTFKLTAYRSSVDMAKEIGPFPIWNWELEKSNNFLNRIKNEDENLYNDMMKYGRRNIALLTIAPTGTVSILTQTTSGIEPLFAYSYFRRVKINNDTETYDEIDSDNNKWKIYEVVHPKLKIWSEINNNKNYNESPYVIAKNIDPYMRVKFQSTLQKHICHSISSTINLPENVSKKTIEDIYLYAWKMGLKGITIYRENSRNNILSSDKPSSTQIIERPKILDCDVHHITYNKKKYIILVGIVNNSPFEVFLLDQENNNIPKHITKGKIEKQKKSLYKLIYENNGKNEIILNNENVNDLYQAITRLISLSLRYKISLNNIVTQLEKINSDLFSFVRAISRTLKKYIQDGTKIDNELCPNCNNETLIREEGCIKCYECGWTKCH